MATIAALAQMIYDTWTADPDSGLVDPIPPNVEALLMAQCTAIATAIGSGVGTGAGGWAQDTAIGPTSTAALAHSPIVASLIVFRNGVLETGWSLVGTTLTFATPLTAGESAVVRYQFYVLV